MAAMEGGETEAVRAALERFCDLGDKHAFELRNGTSFLGWAVEVSGDALLVSWAPTPLYAQATGTDAWAPPDQWIPFADIDLGSLAYWDPTTRGWVDFHEAP